MTRARQAGCKCHWEEGDSECPVHCAGRVDALEEAEGALCRLMLQVYGAEDRAAQRAALSDAIQVIAQMRQRVAVGPDKSDDDVALMCRKDPARAARTIRDLHQERLDHYSREARLMERIEDMERSSGSYNKLASELAVFKGAHVQAVALATAAGKAESVRDQLRIGLLRGQLENARHTALTLCEQHRCCGEFLGPRWTCPSCKATCGCELCRIGRTREWYGLDASASTKESSA